MRETSFARAVVHGVLLTMPLAWVVGCGEPDSSATTGEGTTKDGATTEDAFRYAVPRNAVADRPNVLIITIDTIRADHLGFLGYARPTTPRLDKLSAESIVFEQAYAPIATTLPSHTSMFTGVYPHEHGVLANIKDGRTYERRADLQTLPEFFQRAGYATRAVVAATPLRPQFGLSVGFDGYDAPKGQQRTADKNTAKAIAALEELRASGQPGLLWVHYFDPHGPYTPPYKFEVKFRMDDATRAGLAERQFEARAQRPTGQWNDLEEGIDRYDAEIAFTDAQIRRLLKAAEKDGWIDDAVVAVLGDHGEGLNQHGIAGHGNVWEEQLHVPMFLRIPGVEARRIPEPASLVDFAPTLLHVLDLPGKDAFLSQVTGVNRFRSDLPHDEMRLLGQTSPRQSETGEIGYSLRAGRWKLHVDEDKTATLFDLSSDPFELVDAGPEHPRVLDRLMRDLEDLLRVQRREVRTLEASEEVKDDLRSLGYGGDR